MDNPDSISYKALRGYFLLACVTIGAFIIGYWPAFDHYPVTIVILEDGNKAQVEGYIKQSQYACAGGRGRLDKAIQAEMTRESTTFLGKMLDTIPLEERINKRLKDCGITYEIVEIRTPK